MELVENSDHILLISMDLLTRGRYEPGCLDLEEEKYRRETEKSLCMGIIDNRIPPGKLSSHYTLMFDIYLNLMQLQAAFNNSFQHAKGPGQDRPDRFI